MNLLKAAPGARKGETMGIRPEHLDVGSTGWEVKVGAVELLGAERLIYAQLGDESLIVRVEENAPVPTLGSTIRIAPREDRVHWFDTTSGKRLG